MNATTIEKKIQLGISLAKAREMFPDLDENDGPSSGVRIHEDWYFSSRVTDEMCNHVVYDNNMFRPCVRVGDMFVFRTGSSCLWFEGIGPYAVTGVIHRIMSHPAGREAFLAAMIEETWSKYVASKESAAAVAKEDEPKKTECVADVYSTALQDAEVTIRNQRSRIDDAERRAAAFEAELEQLRADTAMFKPHVGTKAICRRSKRSERARQSRTKM